MQVLLQGVQDAGNVIQSGQLAFKVSTPDVATDGCCDWCMCGKCTVNKAANLIICCSHAMSPHYAMQYSELHCME